MKYFYLIKFVLYGGFATYDYFIDDKLAIVWLLASLLMLAFYITDDIVDRLKPKI